MNTDQHQNTGTEPLDVFFDAARAQAPDLSADLRTRILANADSALSTASVPARHNPNLRQRVGIWLTGWAAPSLAGGVTAAVAGFWFGVVAPMPVAALDAPLWLQDALGYFEAISTPIVGLDDPLLWGF